MVCDKKINTSIPQFKISAIDDLANHILNKMKITEVRIREVLIPRIYETYASDLLRLQDDDRKKSCYQIIELFTDNGHVGVGEVSDIADRMNPLSVNDLTEIFQKTVVGIDLLYWPLIYQKTAQELT